MSPAQVQVVKGIALQAQAKAPPKPVVLPRIRDELALFPAAPNDDGTPAWMMQDPVTNRFFRIGWIDFELLLHWADFDAAALVAEVKEQTPFNVTLADVPARKQDLVSGRYELPAPPSGSAVAVKVIDMLGEERVVVLTT